MQPTSLDEVITIIRDFKHGMEKRDNTIAILHQRIEEIEAALDKYGIHQRGCPINPFAFTPYAFSEERRKELAERKCTCGLGAARKEE